MLIGRDGELRRIIELVDGTAGTGGRCVVLEAEAGMGKTSIVTAAITHAAQAGHRTLVARPSRAETPLAFAVLTDLLRGVPLDVLDERPRRLLETALGRRDHDGGGAPQVHELGGAVIDVLHGLAGVSPVVVVVDDQQWVDAASNDVLRYVLRRLPAPGVSALVARRPDGAEPPDGDRLVLAPLPDDTVEALVSAAAPTPLPPHLAAQVVRTAGGNPMFALELAASARTAGASPARPLRLPESLAALVGRRFTTFDDHTLHALGAVSMLSRPTVDDLHQLGLLDALHPAERAGVVSIDGRTVVFRHPVLATAAHDALTPTQRIALHERLADITTGTERIIHRALGAARRDATVAAQLIEAAVDAGARGAPVEAGELSLLAVEATPDDDPDRWTRTLTAADLMFRAGRTEEAVDLFRRVEDGSPVSVDRHRALLLHATVEYSRSDDAEVASQLVRRVVAEADDADLLAEAHSVLARTEYVDFDRAVVHADAALALVGARPEPDPRTLASAINAAMSARFLAGHGLDREAYRRAVDLEAAAGVPLDADSSFAALAAHLKYADDLDESRRMLELLARQSDPASLPYALGHLPQLHLWAGRWDEAERVARQHLHHAEQTAQQSQVFTARFNLANIAAHRGDVDDARPLAQQLYETGRDGQVPWTERNGAGLLGIAAMAVGDAATAVPYLRRYLQLGVELKLREPGYHRYDGDLVEALIATGEVDEAAAVVDALAALADPLGRRSAMATVRRGRALLAAHAGRRVEALTQAQESLDLLEGTSLAYERARAELTLGVVGRRFKDRGLARQALSAAFAAFTAMGAATFAERVRRELERVSGRGDVESPQRLTATEQRVAGLAAIGRTTRQIADELFISTKTVEANLTRVYRKLGVSNRAQLAHRLGDP